MWASTLAYAENLTFFLNRLRSLGLTIGIDETLDVFALIDHTLLDESKKLRVSMRSILAKSQREQEIFDECFDGFFIAAEIAQQKERQVIQENDQRTDERKKALKELTFDGKPIELSDELKDLYADMSNSKRQKLKNYFGLSTENQRKSPFTYNFMRRILEQQLLLDDVMEEQNDAASGCGCNDLLYKDISLIGEDEMPSAVALIQTMVKQLSGAISRSYRRSGKRGRLDFRNTIRAGMGTGGSFYKLKFKRRHRCKKKLVLLCDVSGSMLKYSEFAIRFIKSMSEISQSSRVFMFSEGLSEVSPFVLDDMNRFQSSVKGSGLWGKGTDVAAALDELMALRPALLGSNAILMLISDTKSVKLEAARVSMQRAALTAEKMIWLNPIPSRKWLKMGSVKTFIDLCEMLDCSTIHELSRACAKSLAL